MAISYNPLPNGHIVQGGVAVDDTLKKVMARQLDGRYVWINNANNPAIATESLVWDTAGNISIQGLSLSAPFIFSGSVTTPIIAIGGQANNVSVAVIPTVAVLGATTQTIALYSRIDGIAAGNSAERLAAVFEASTGGGLGAGTGNFIGALNINAYQQPTDTTTQIVTCELSLNSNKADATLDMSPPQVGMSIGSSGSHIAGIACFIGGAPQWMEGIQIALTGIAVGGYAFRYKGDGVHGAVTISADSKLTVANGILGQITPTGSTTIAVQGTSASLSTAAIVGSSTGFYGGQFFNVTDLGTDLANANAIGLVGQSAYSNALYAQQGAISGTGSTLARNNIYPALYATRVVGSLNGFDYTAPIFRIDETTAATGGLMDVKKTGGTVVFLMDKNGAITGTATAGTGLTVDRGIKLSTTNATVTGPSFAISSNVLRISTGTSGMNWISQDQGTQLGGITNAGIFTTGAPGSTTGAAAFDWVMPNNNWLRMSNAGATSAVQVIQLDSSDRVVVAGGTNNVILGFGGGIVLIGASTTTGAAASEIVMNKSKSLRAINNAATNTYGLIQGNTSDQVVLSPDGSSDIKWAKANVALGGGAAPTFGTIGGSGPAAAAQRNWLRFIESDGTASFIPVWR